jgi:hypothetical protein
MPEHHMRHGLVDPSSILEERTEMANNGSARREAPQESWMEGGVRYVSHRLDAVHRARTKT